MKTIGVMTGNSLDAVDAVLTEFVKGDIKDIDSISVPYPSELKQKFLQARSMIKNKEIVDLENNIFLKELIDEYTTLVAKVVNILLKKHDNVEAVGFHGQTLDHFPPSIARGSKPYSLQVGNALLLSKITKLPVAYDFRSDDILNGGEGAPLAPVHNLHIAQDLKLKGVFPIAFCNAGNTGNISIILKNIDGDVKIFGWDIGPFNHFSDYLVRRHKNEDCDRDGRYGKQGNIIPDLLEKMFDNIAVDLEDNNFYLISPPKSSDPSWYKVLVDMDCLKYSFYDVLRTVEYLSTYSFVFNLKYVPEDIDMPNRFLLFGGGWKNPICMNDFESLLKGNSFILDKHKIIFNNIYSRLVGNIEVSWSDKYGYSGEFMEARIFADMARCLLENIPFTFPDTTNCKSPTVCGIWAYPSDDESKHHIVSRTFLEK